MLICDLIDAIKPGFINYDLLKTTGTPEVWIYSFFLVYIFFFNSG
jgi:hypothetical protein